MNCYISFQGESSFVQSKNNSVWFKQTAFKEMR